MGRARRASFRSLGDRSASSSWQPGPIAYRTIRCSSRVYSRWATLLRGSTLAPTSVLHGARPDALVGFAHSAPLVVPRAPARAPDRLAAALRDLVLNRLPVQLMAGSSGRWLDFIGVNYYCRTLVHWRAEGIGALFGRDWLVDDQGEPRAFSDIGWEIYPAGLQQQLRRFARYGVPLVITENGLATSDERLRTESLRAHLHALAAAVAEGLPVAGYCYWTLMDNYEWSLGTGPRFGLAATDFATQQRTPRPAAAFFAQVCRGNALPAEGDSATTTARGAPGTP